MPIGAKVTLRGERMHDFLDKLINVSCRVFVTSTVFPKVLRWPRNYTLGVREQLIFQKSITMRLMGSWLDVVIVTTAMLMKRHSSCSRKSGCHSQIREVRYLAKKSMIAKTNGLQNLQSRNIRGANGVAVRIPYIVNSNSAGFALLS